jgi:hypothetical protein
MRTIESRNSKLNLGKRIMVILVVVILMVSVVTSHTLMIAVQETTQLLITSCMLVLFVAIGFTYSRRYTNLQSLKLINNARNLPLDALMCCSLKGMVLIDHLCNVVHEST